MTRWALILILVMAPALSHAQTPSIRISNAHIGNARIAPPAAAVVDPCQGVAVGDPCTNGVLYAGTGFAGLGSYKYMTTPGNCTDSATPVCNGAIDTLQKMWANNSGTTAYGVNTGAMSDTAGASNTMTLATNYTDTDAARYCENMTYPVGGYTDWYLPAKDELNLVLFDMQSLGKGNFAAADYWSSTEYDVVIAWTQTFPGGFQGFLNKSGLHYVRCVRRY